MECDAIPQPFGEIFHTRSTHSTTSTFWHDSATIVDYQALNPNRNLLAR